MKTIEGPAIESTHSRTQADRRTFLKAVGASAVSDDRLVASAA